MFEVFVEYLCASRSRSNNSCPTVSPSHFSLGSANINRHIMTSTTIPDRVNASETANNAQVLHRRSENNAVDLNVFLKTTCNCNLSVMNKHFVQVAPSAMRTLGAAKLEKNTRK